MRGSKASDVFRRIGDALMGAILVVLPVAVLVDLTVAHGVIPNGILIGIWLGVWAWVFATHGAAERERLERLSVEEAESHGLVRIPDDTPLPVGFPLFPSDQQPAGLARATVRGRSVFLFDVDAVEDHRWWDDEPSTRRFTVCLVHLSGSLPRFHIEVGNGLARFRRRWPKPELVLPGVGSCDPLPHELDVWVRDPRTIDLLAAFPTPSQIRVEGPWLAVFMPSSHSRVRLVDAALALCDRVPRSLYTRED